MAVNLQKGQRVDLKKSDGSALRNVMIGLGWDEALVWAGMRRNSQILPNLKEDSCRDFLAAEEAARRKSTISTVMRQCSCAGTENSGAAMMSCTSGILSMFQAQLPTWAITSPEKATAMMNRYS